MGLFFAKIYQYPTLKAEILYATRQEHVIKYVKRTVLVAHFGVLERRLCGWYIEEITSMVNCCITIHNMITEARSN